ncbi:MAG TPA: hypothetical protein PLH43_10265 [Acetivibrio sp.]|mgnify:CR=1 FL=1|uniref:hypothetical protein n=1 Tax=Acetivibrio sp. TaxID=1872092 RepID=UPI002D1D8095|nr:hypothetical protein [Acetivibrio sp.]HOM03198.1 hypothetical protein [Acetivibrio sp.]
MKHTYIFEEGNWKAEGLYFDHENNCVGVYGETSIKHLKDEWILDGFMELKTENPIRFFNKYSIKPISDRKDYTSWTSENPALGKLIGKFMIIGDTILSSYISENGIYSGTESLFKIDENTYLNRGFAFNRENKLSSWEVKLERV